MRKGLESTNQTRANKHKRGPKDKANKRTKHDTTQIPTLSPPLASRRQKGREDTYTHGVAQAEKSSHCSSCSSSDSAAGIVSSMSSSELVHL